MLLVKKAQNGDADAFVALMEQNKMTMQRVANGFFRNEEDVADAIADTVLDAFEHLYQLKRPAYFKTWLVKILINNCNRIYNSKKNLTAIEDFRDMGYMDANQADVDFREMLESLPEGNRMVFQLYYGESFTTREIGEILDMKENTVKSRLHRGKEQLRQELWIGGRAYETR